MTPQSTEATAVANQHVGLDEFSSLLDREFKPKTEEARGAVEAAVRTLAQQALVAARARRR